MLRFISLAYEEQQAFKYKLIPPDQPKMNSVQPKLTLLCYTKLG